MAIESRVWDESYDAAVDLSAKQYFIVKLDANGRIVLAAAAGDTLLGILQNDPSALGRPGTVRQLGISKAVAGAAITLGDEVISDGAGKVISTATAGDRILGVALEAAAADGDVISISMTGPYDRHA